MPPSTRAGCLRSKMSQGSNPTTAEIEEGINNAIEQFHAWVPIHDTVPISDAAEIIRDIWQSLRGWHRLAIRGGQDLEPFPSWALSKLPNASIPRSLQQGDDAGYTALASYFTRTDKRFNNVERWRLLLYFDNLSQNTVKTLSKVAKACEALSLQNIYDIAEKHRSERTRDVRFVSGVDEMGFGRLRFNTYDFLACLPRTNNSQGRRNHDSASEDISELHETTPEYDETTTEYDEIIVGHGEGFLEYDETVQGGNETTIQSNEAHSHPTDNITGTDLLPEDDVDNRDDSYPEGGRRGHGADGDIVCPAPHYSDFFDYIRTEKKGLVYAEQEEHSIEKENQLTEQRLHEIQQRLHEAQQRRHRMGNCVRSGSLLLSEGNELQKRRADILRPQEEIAQKAQAGEEFLLHVFQFETYDNFCSESGGMTEEVQQKVNEFGQLRRKRQKLDDDLQ